MINNYKLIRECSRREIRLMADGDNLKIDAPKGAITPELKEYLIKAKPELLPVLTHMQEIGFTWDRERELWTFTGTASAQNEQVC
jgi:hypothetical protein